MESSAGARQLELWSDGRPQPAVRRAIFTIPAGLSFVHVLAAGLLARNGDDPLALAATTVLLPTRRAGRALVDAFLRVTRGRALVLPRILPLGDIEEDAFGPENELPAVPQADPLVSAPLARASSGPAALELPQAISPLRRQLLLARLIQAMARATRQGPRSADQAARLAMELGRLLDQVQIERLSFDGLAALVPDEFAAHWQITLEFLELLTREWPKILAAEGRIDPAERRNRILAAQAAAWRARPPAAPVIAAGSTATDPATVDLLAAILDLPAGEVVLPGLDQVLDDGGWAALEPAHPQWNMARLLDALDLRRRDVATWPWADRPAGSGAEGRSADPAANEARRRLLSETMRPAVTTEAWRNVDLDIGKAVEGLARIDCSGPEDEARVVALLLREAVEAKSSAALVTPDRSLARRVAAEMRRWGIDIDDSAGRPLNETPTCVFLRLTAAMAASGGAPVSLLATLKHPLAAGRREPGAFRRLVRQLEILALRGPRPAPGFEGLLRILERRLADREADDDGAEVSWDETRHEDGAGRNGLVADVAALVTELRRLADPLMALLASPEADLGAILAAHIRLVEDLATVSALDEETGRTTEKAGAERLWAREDGEAAARFLSDLLEAAPAFGPVAGSDYPALLEALMAAPVVRPAWGTNPTVAILGTLEARLLHLDHLILGGLNEGSWPPQGQSDPWMSRPMRQGLGLPAPERRIGLSAHDFAQAACAPRVTLTRAARAEGAPTVPSRWLLRLDSVLRAAGFAGRLGEPARWLAWAAALDRPAETQPSAPPFPRPPLAIRPRRFSVGEIETWLRDPYAVYARRILDLAPLPGLDADPGAADRGAYIHQALERFVQEHAGALPEDALDRLVAIGQEVFGASLDRPAVAAFWWPRFERAARWAVERERERRISAAAVHTRPEGQLRVPGTVGDVLVTARIDRVDVLRDGRLALVEYKTGSCPDRRHVHSCASPELPILAAVAETGGFPGIDGAQVAELSYWVLHGRNEGGEAVSVTGDRSTADLAVAAREGLERWVAAFDDPDTPYLAQPRPGLVPRFGDYDHLARIKEWIRGPG